MRNFIKIQNAVPKIVSVEQFEEANRVRESRINEGEKKRGRKPTYTDVYFQKIKCGVCGKGFKKQPLQVVVKTRKLTICV